MAGGLVVCPRPVVSGAFQRPVGSAVAGPVASGSFVCPVAGLVVQCPVQ